MRSRGSRFLTATGAIAAGTAVLAHAAYRKDIDAARQRITTERQVVDSAHGPIEFAESGDGPAALLIHGAGGGFDQGLDLGRAFLGDDSRIIAPSRFGYLGTPLPADASAEAQADAHLWLLDALRLDTVPVIGVSAGAPSAMQLCLKHPERCSALVLVVPLAWAPECLPDAPSPFFETVLNAITASDFLFWTATKVARMSLLKTILGTPVPDYRNAMPEERRNVDRMLESILPISRRAEGIRNDSIVSVNLTRYELEDIRVPTLVISAADDLYGTYEPGRYTAEQIPNGKFVGFRTGGHLLLGHDAEVRTRVRSFLTEHAEATKRRATAV
ncbi:MAG TPA: alpha/beta fold hydrolase [Thermoanaerobaculia bacterium]|nr:alpha/beta fold hydrolase [Thermoanaerobaculia bacterium]